MQLITRPEHVKIGRLVVRQDYRGEGIARSLMTAAMDLARTDCRFQLDAQVDKIGFYEKFGFLAYGPEFMDGGIPHRAMKTF